MVDGASPYHYDVHFPSFESPRNFNHDSILVVAKMAQTGCKFLLLREHQPMKMYNTIIIYIFSINILFKVMTSLGLFRRNFNMIDNIEGKCRHFD